MPDNTRCTLCGDTESQHKYNNCDGFTPPLR